MSTSSAQLLPCLQRAAHSVDPLHHAPIQPSPIRVAIPPANVAQMPAMSRDEHFHASLRCARSVAAPPARPDRPPPPDRRRHANRRQPRPGTGSRVVIIYRREPGQRRRDEIHRTPAVAAVDATNRPRGNSCPPRIRRSVFCHSEPNEVPVVRPPPRRIELLLHGMQIDRRSKSPSRPRDCRTPSCPILQPSSRQSCRRAKSPPAQSAIRVPAARQTHTAAAASAQRPQWVVPRASSSPAPQPRMSIRNTRTPRSATSAAIRRM